MVAAATVPDRTKAVPTAVLTLRAPATAAPAFVAVAAIAAPAPFIPPSMLAPRPFIPVNAPVVLLAAAPATLPRPLPPTAFPTFEPADLAALPRTAFVAIFFGSLSFCFSFCKASSRSPPEREDFKSAFAPCSAFLTGFISSSFCLASKPLF